MTNPTPSTEQIIFEMMTQRVGTSFMDSGGEPHYNEDGTYSHSSYGYGRSFERLANQPVTALSSQPEVTWHTHIYIPTIYEGTTTRPGTPELDLSITRSTFHFLSNTLEFAPELDALFHEWASTREDTHWLLDMEEFPVYLESLDCDIADVSTVNTYNGECILDTTLQWVMFTLDHAPEDSPAHEWCGLQVVLLQTHNGADVRGGYSAPRIFTPVEDIESFLLYNDATISCNRPQPDPRQPELPIPNTSPANTEPHTWYTDDGYHWYSDDRDIQDLKDYPAAYLPDTDSAPREPNTLFISRDDDTLMLCPVCGSPMEFYAN